MPPAPSANLESPVQVLFGVGTERAAQLGRLEIRTISDLLLHRPRRYEDRRHFLAIRDLKLKEPATVRGRIVAQGTKYFRKRTNCVFEIVLDDGTARLHCRWWNLPFMARLFRTGDDVMVYGRLLAARPRTMDHPETEVLEAGEDASIHLDRLVPIYPSTEGLPQRWLRSLIWRTLDGYVAQVMDPWPLPQRPDSSRQVLSRREAIQLLHFPREMEDAEAARQRLALDELLDVQVAMQRRRRNLETRARAPLCPGTNRLIKPFLASLPFELTRAQTRVLREIRKDMGAVVPMRRLLQGDVGAGKTVVAACAALMAVESGRNVTLMAPTEILAGQHFGSLGRWFVPLGVPVSLQTGGTKMQLPPSPSLIIGTHALITPDFEIPNLGLVIIDEQHKFGVAQREQLARKGGQPHLLVMTATPIPRTLGLTIYGDLDSSVLDELPRGRGRIRTFVRTQPQLPKVYEFMRAQLRAGRQAYVVYARVSEADTDSGIKAAMTESRLLASEFAPHQVGLLHGRLGAAEKERIMTGFRENRIQVLLATSVIEVGVDVPNATVMVVENADQFGLAQLHQLRGRVGRGAHESYCILLADAKNAGARERLAALEQSDDGFAIAEADLRIRGPGDFLGVAQSGLPPFRFADLIADGALVEVSRQVAQRIVAGAPAASPAHPQQR